MGVVVGEGAWVQERRWRKAWRCPRPLRPTPSPNPPHRTLQAGPGDRTILLFLTHAADLAPWELVPRVVKALPALRAAGVGVVMTVLGSAANAREFQARLSIPDGVLFADPAAATHDALGFSKGFDPAGPVKLPPYVRLAAMLAGVGSPGTMAEVARGYLGDRAAPQVFPSGPFDVLGTGYQRPMELATLRLNSMISVLSDCEWGWGGMGGRNGRVWAARAGAWGRRRAWRVCLRPQFTLASPPSTPSPPREEPGAPRRRAADPAGRRPSAAGP